MGCKIQQTFQIFVDAPELQIPARGLTIQSRNFTLEDLKNSILPPAIRSLASLFFTFNGRPLSDSTVIQNSQITPSSTLTLRCRLLGGGGDGGATGAESRDCYLNMYASKKPDKVDPNEQRLSKWLNCALSNEPLKHPVVVDKLGNLFNKQRLVEGLLSKNLPKAFGHIKGLKDMIPVELDSIPGSESNVSETRFQCPISGLEFNGKYRFFALRTCGHVLSAKALKEVKSSACLVCHKEFSQNDKLVINGTEEEVADLRERLEEEKARLEEEKAKLKEKKAKKVKNGDVGGNVKEDVDVGTELLRLSGRKHGMETKTSEKALAKIEGNGKVANGRATNGLNNGSGKRFKASDVAPPNATKEVYASIFTSSRKSDFKETYSCRSLPLGRN